MDQWSADEFESDDWEDDEDEGAELSSLQEMVKEDKEDLTIKIMQEPEWRKRASLAAKIISQSYE